MVNKEIILERIEKLINFYKFIRKGLMPDETTFIPKVDDYLIYLTQIKKIVDGLNENIPDDLKRLVEIRSELFNIYFDRALKLDNQTQETEN